jgi:general secretion pathway protein K
MQTPANWVERNSEQGAILAVVLWFVTLMTLLVVSLGRDVRSNVDLARLEISRLQTSSILDSAVEIAAARVLAAGDKAPAIWDGSAQNVNFGGASVELRITDASGLVDIARAEPDLLQALADRALGAGANSNALVEAILERRAKGENKTTAEVPFQSVDEVYELASGDLRLVDKLMPLIGLYSKNGKINVTSSPQTVIESTPGISTTDIDQIQSLRRRGDAGISALRDIVARYSKYLSVEPGNVFLIEARIVKGKHLMTGSSLRATIALDPKNLSVPYQVVRLSW